MIDPYTGIKIVSPLDLPKDKSKKITDIIEAIDAVKYHRPWKWDKLLLSLQNYVLEHYQVFITSDDAALILLRANHDSASELVGDDNNVMTEHFPGVIEDFLESVDATLQCQISRQERR